MKNATRGALLFLLAGSVAVASGGCGSEEAGGGGGAASTVAPGDMVAAGTPCTADAECTGLGACITDDTFSALTEGEVAEFPGGYCSKFPCIKDTGEETCGEGGYCFNLEQYLGQQLAACLHVCETDADCREGYICHDGAEGHPLYVPMPHKACMTESLLCVLDIPQPSCPNAGQGGAGGGT